MDRVAAKINTGFDAIIRADIPAIFLSSKRTFASQYVKPTVSDPAIKKNIREEKALTPKSLNPAKTTQ